MPGVEPHFSLEGKKLSPEVSQEIAAAAPVAAEIVSAEVVAIQPVVNEPVAEPAPIVTAEPEVAPVPEPVVEPAPVVTAEPEPVPVVEPAVVPVVEVAAAVEDATVSELPVEPEPPAIPALPYLRELTSHQVGGLNEVLSVQVVDEPGVGGSSHRYRIVNVADQSVFCDVKFQEGAIAEAGVNGISNEALLAIVKDRLEGFQSGKFRCEENAIALSKVESALKWMRRRTETRLARGVEGTHKV